VFQPKDVTQPPLGTTSFETQAIESVLGTLVADRCVISFGVEAARVSVPHHPVVRVILVDRAAVELVLSLCAPFRAGNIVAFSWRRQLGRYCVDALLCTPVKHSKPS
jgi:hypothetical protein